MVCSPGLFLVPCPTPAQPSCPGSGSHQTRYSAFVPRVTVGLAERPGHIPQGMPPPPGVHAMLTNCDLHLGDPPPQSPCRTLGNAGPRGAHRHFRKRRRGPRAGSASRASSRKVQHQNPSPVAASLTQHLLSPAPPQAFLRRAAEPPTERMPASKPSSFPAEL